ncbi:hypothetical protein BST20_00110 [Mycobacterium branderi]|uniref:Uncharacterized protein n=2 Tax=Mycobacterium branderi TaxID=43348 RepID=A0A7I7WET7_9MYCO|nr:hypothetical protein BST20_00110 [Mycobacterium branderi]BBZ14468.1 hypothetical protein MBRA_46630 [Mycobacterium branderi]
MKRDELFASIEAARPGRDDVVYLARRGEQYEWRVVPAGGVVTDLRPSFFDDLLAELETMAARTDRCRWPLDEPWPHTH